MYAQWGQNQKKYKQSYLLKFFYNTLTVLFVLNSDSWGLPNVFSWELNISKLLVVEEVGGANFHGFIFLWAREDEIFVNFKLGNHKDD